MPFKTLCHAHGPASVSCGLTPQDYLWTCLIGSVEIRNDCPSREIEEATMAINVRDMEASF